MSGVPRFSVVVPTHERPRALARCLAALAALRYPGDRYEVVIVDDGSHQSPDEIVAGWRGRLAVRLLVQPRAGPGAARNRGAEAARGEVLAFTDDDCAPDREWLWRFAEALSRDPDRGLGGRTVNALTGNRYATASQLLIDYLYEYFNARPGRIPLYTSNNLTLSREAFLAVGGFDEAYSTAGGEDRDLCERWVRAGHRLEFVPDAVVRHHHELDLAGFLRQHFNYGLGAGRFHRLRSPDGSPRHRPEPLAFYRDLVFFPFRRADRDPVRLAALLTLSQVANAAGFLRALLGQGRA